MAFFKCKMCGGDLEVKAGMTVAECEYCGTNQTLPNLDDDKKINMYDRANHFRRNNEFDKAMGIYEQILNEDKTDAESYWSLVLCRYGIEYVEDPSTHKRVPTVNRAQYTSIFADEDYKSALQYADMAQKIVYEAEAKAIDEIQKGILEISQKEDPFDIFICYKDTDNNGRRTPDSVLANDLYHQLTTEGFKVFYSRITLEDKLGTAYEPYIFAALNSAKVMVVLGTKPEYFNAVWVKNEWSRYLAMIKNGAKKMLVPAYKDMDPYDLPEEFSHLQAQDMSKLGFMQDLIRGIKKILETEKDRSAPVKETVVMQTSSGNIKALLDRGQIALEDAEWDRAEMFFEDVLNQDAKNAEAYIGKALVQHKCCNLEALVDFLFDKYSVVTNERKIAFQDDDNHIQKVIEEYEVPGYLEVETIKELYEYDRTYISELDERRKALNDAKVYWEQDKNLSKAIRYASDAEKEKIDSFKQELDNRLSLTIEKAQNEEEKYIYEKKLDYEESFLPSRDEIIKTRYNQAISNRDADIKAQKKREEENEKNQILLNEKRKKTYKVVAIVVAVFVIVFMGLTITEPARYMSKAQKLIQSGEYEVAISILEEIEQTDDVSELLLESKYLYAEQMTKSDMFEAAMLYAELGDYKEAKQKNIECWNNVRKNPTIAAGFNYTVAVKEDGTVAAAGDNEKGQCNVSSWNNIVSVVVGPNHTIGLKSDGTVVATGDNEDGQCNVSGWKDIISVATGDDHTVGLKADGTVVFTGTGDRIKECEKWHDIVQVVASCQFIAGLKADGTVEILNDYLGSNSFYEKIKDEKDVKKIVSCVGTIAALKNDGTVVVASVNEDRYNTSSLTGIKDIFAGYHELIILKEDGTIRVLGAFVEKYNAEAYKWKNIVEASSAYDHLVALRENGTVVAIGNPEYDQGECNVSSWKNIKVS